MQISGLAAITSEYRSLIGSQNVEDRRRFERTPTSIRVEMTHPSIGVIIGSTNDISDGGAQVSIENQSLLPVGTIVNVMFKKVVGPVNAEPIQMRVMHTHKNVLGLMFVN